MRLFLGLPFILPGLSQGVGSGFPVFVVLKQLAANASDDIGLGLERYFCLQIVGLQAKKGGLLLG